MSLALTTTHENDYFQRSIYSEDTPCTCAIPRSPAMPRRGSCLPVIVWSE
jgi:hypothetical protein